jgi:enediyne biosynthesis protein E4
MKYACLSIFIGFLILLADRRSGWPIEPARSLRSLQQNTSFRGRVGKRVLRAFRGGRHSLALPARFAGLTYRPSRKVVNFLFANFSAREGSAIKSYWRLARIVGFLAIFGFGCDSKSNPIPEPEGQATKPKSVSDTQTPPFEFTDLSSQTGITFVHNNQARGKFQLVEAMTGGVALFDFDLDRFADVYFCNGKPLSQGNSVASNEAVFFRNLGSMKFTDATAQSGASSKQYCLGVTVGDYDNDGFPDLYLSNFGPNQLLHNNGDGTFTDVTSDSPVKNGNRLGAGVSFADFNKDGAADLFVGNYVKLKPEDLANALPRAKYPGPLDYSTESCSLFLSDGTGGWVDATEKTLIGAVSGTAMGVITGDFDNDNNSDIYVANDEMPNSLFLNSGNLSFSESAYSFGVAVDLGGRVNGSMGVDVADADNDGLNDILVTSFARELVTLYKMTPHGVFKDVTLISRIGEGTAPHVTWGCCFADFDHDGDRDVYIGSGHFDETSEYWRVRDLVYKNLLVENGGFLFQEIGKQIKGLEGVAQCSRGTAVSDLDNDGDMDIVVLNVNAPATILRNDLPRSKSSNWIKVRLVGRSIMRDAVGAKIQILGGKSKLVDEVRNGRGYQSFWGEWLHFGLGSVSSVDLKVLWPDGNESVYPGLPANTEHLLVQ